MNDQRSTTEQLKDIYVLAVKAGHYDGANCILNIIGEGFKMEKYGFKEVGVYDNDGTGSSPVHNIVSCEFFSGYLAALQFLVIGHGMDSIAEEAMRESGYTEKEFLKVQTQTGFETRKMNSVIRNAFSR